MTTACHLAIQAVHLAGAEGQVGRFDVCQAQFQSWGTQSMAALAVTMGATMECTSTHEAAAVMQ